MNKKVMKLASRGKRLGAYCIDKIIPAILFMIVANTISNIGNSMSYAYGYGYYGYGVNTSSIGAVVSIVIAIAAFIAYLVVQLVFYSKSKTIGKAILSMQVISSVDGKPVGIWKMILREWFAKKASGSVLLLGYIWILIDEKNRGWHDKIMDTYVVDVAESRRLGVDMADNEYEQAAAVSEVSGETVVKENITDVDEVITESYTDTSEHQTEIQDSYADAYESESETTITERTE